MRARTHRWSGFAAGLFALLMAPSARGGVLYDLGDFPFTFSGATNVHATLETTVTGTFTTEAEIENFFNSATYNVILKDGPTTLMELNNLNASWDLRFEALGGGSGGASATLTSTPTAVSLDFSTPNEITSVALILGGPPSLMQFRQSNNVSDFNFVDVDHQAVFGAFASLPYDAPFVFPARATIPEPSAFLLIASSWIGLRRFSRRRRSRMR